MKVSVFGGTGFIGKKLVQELKNRGHEAVVLDLRKNPDWAEKMLATDAVVNLAGYSLFKKRWNVDVKSEIYDSRVEGTKAIVHALGAAKDKGQKIPSVLVNGSAIGFYGPENDVEFDERAHAGADFLAFVCRDWEEAAEGAKQHGIRTVLLRTGVVLGKEGGALEQLLPPFKAFAGGPVGSGKQWMSWIHIEDIVGLIIHALENKSVEGPLNGTAPNPVRNKDFATALGKALHRPAKLPLPGLMLYFIVGEAAEILVNGQKVLPKVAQATGYKYKHPELNEALATALA